MNTQRASSLNVWMFLRDKFINVRNWWRKICEEDKRSVTLMIFLMRLMGLWHSSNDNQNDQLLNNKLEKFWSVIMRFIVTIFMIHSIYVQTQDLYYFRNSIEQITFSGLSAIIVYAETLKLFVFFAMRNKVIELNKLVYNEFWNKTYHGKEKKIIHDCDVFCFRAIILYLFMIFGTCTHFLLHPIIGMQTDNTRRRELPFPEHFALWLYESPFYEIYFGVQMIGTSVAGLCMTTFSTYPFVISKFMAAQFAILNQKLESICDNIIDADVNSHREALGQLIQFVNEHQKLTKLTKRINTIYCYPLLVQVIGSVIQICFSGSQLFLVSTTFQRKLLSAEFLLSSSLQILFYCLSAHVIYEKSDEVSLAVLSCKWYRVTDPRIEKQFRQAMIIMAIGAHTPCSLSVGKIYPMKLSIFVSIVNTSISYFMVLRKFIK